MPAKTEWQETTEFHCSEIFVLTEEISLYHFYKNGAWNILRYNFTCCIYILYYDYLHFYLYFKKVTYKVPLLYFTCSILNVLESIKLYEMWNQCKHPNTFNLLQLETVKTTYNRKTVRKLENILNINMSMC